MKNLVGLLLAPTLAAAVLLACTRRMETTR
jgi:hypothetical protein